MSAVVIEGRRQAILEVAAAAFFEQGYAATSIDALIERFDGPRPCVSAMFDDKESLFTALVAEGADMAVAALSVEETGGRVLYDALTAFGRSLVGIYMSPRLLGIYRTIVTEGPRFHGLARAFYEEGPGRTVGRLAEVLHASGTQGFEDLDDCQHAARHFVGLLRDSLLLQVVLKLRPPPSSEEIEAAVAMAVRIFLDGVGMAPSKPSARN